ncbi:hypothetical protein [Lacimicrobium sp. SS2-24]|uniref:hypothetical protein n=1 Tax=Lacimicrobium sp. SS2-24 TaxID=2005569 RepID=UPI000B4B6C55|nr:hypothetical protein [Lacimicrobium sp. SS2-24]
MLLFGLCGLLVVIVIYLVIRTQMLQQELNQQKLWQKSADKQRRYLLQNMGYLSAELQNNLIKGLNKTHQHRLISQRDYELALFILNNTSNIVLMCFEKGLTVQEAMKKLTNSSGIDMEELRKFIAEQPNPVRMAWSKNQPSGFIRACSLISMTGQLDVPQTISHKQANKDAHAELA